MEQLAATGRKERTLLKTMGQEKAVVSHRIFGMEVSGLDETACVELPYVYTQMSIPVTTDNFVSQDDLKRWPYLKEVKLHHIDSDIGVLIGVNAPKALEPWKIINSEGNGPYIVKAVLGWVLNGPLSSGSFVEENDFPLVCANRISIANLDELLTKHYNQDFVEHCPDKEEISVEDKQFLNIMQSSVTFQDGHYYLTLPFRNPNVVVPNNRQLAKQRIHYLLRKFKKDTNFYEEYKKFLNDVISKGYAEPVPQEVLNQQDGKVWYIPHHGVYHPRKSTIQVVFDCASSLKGTSLNHELLQGPDLTNSLLGVLIRFRQHPIALMADIEAMFHHSKDQNFSHSQSLIDQSPFN